MAKIKSNNCVLIFYYPIVLEKPVAGAMATSCADLKQLGHTKSSFYTVKASQKKNKLSTVYCDFTKDVKSKAN